MREQMIQLGTNLYALKSDVVRIYKTDERSPGLVYVVLRSHDSLLGGATDVYRTTDWPIERVARALGLSDGTVLHEMVEGA